MIYGISYDISYDICGGEYVVGNARWEMDSLSIKYITITAINYAVAMRYSLGHSAQAFRSGYPLEHWQGASFL